MNKLPKYLGYQLTMSMLTDEVVNTALERFDAPMELQAETARNALYDYMSYTSVSAEHMDAFNAELMADPEFHDDGCNGLGYLEALADIVDDLLDGNEVVKYRDENIKNDDVEEAMSATGVQANATEMATLIATYIVCGKTGLNDPDGAGLLIEQTGLSLDAVIKTASYMIGN